MTITVNLSVLIARKGITSKELSRLVGINEQNLSLLKNGKIKGIRLETLNQLCKHLGCQPGDILSYEDDDQ
ncbi:helix-turn-helix domain-containing protein [Intestinirhabdus alba]|jgi:putative transcriptional regulator|uniref:Helix-turn-helix domain-containing protein n=1 Tax=Intestinirhabdus alba TaxID=2899544 RepID=A0A6L6IFG8_9ENTR|nr:helix-turn-helix transcriptional regulator [Intestinirhabdus alba]MTH45511.1 helix-turn-helix domain-containing protein [Intestinirhabdus alba]